MGATCLLLYEKIPGRPLGPENDTLWRADNSDVGL